MSPQATVGAKARGAMLDARGAHADAPPAPVQPCGANGGKGSKAGKGKAANDARPVVDKPTHWIEVVLVDDDGRPVEGVAWRVEAADGEVFEGTLDETGVARVPTLTPGPAKVSFPKLDGRSWSAG